MNRHAAVAPLLAALLAFAAYAATLAPTVTFEDSGELITAAYRLGVPHEPGYPLYTLLGHLATQLPLGTVAYRLNLLSAICTALGIFFFTAALQHTCAALWRHARPHDSGIHGCVAVVSLAGGLLAAFAWETWEQSIITEVYGLHLAFFGLVVLLMVRWTLGPRHRRRTITSLGLTLGLAVSHHPSAVMWFPAALACVALTAWRDAFAPATLLRAAAAFAAGLLPLAYLPWASARNPIIDWGDPETPGRLLQVITRHQYGTDAAGSIQDLLDQATLLARLTAEQWPPATLLLLIPGLVLLARSGRRLLVLAGLLWLAAGPLMALLSNFRVNGGDPVIDAEIAALASVFFIPAHWVLAFVAAVGLLFVGSRVPPQFSRIASVAALLVPVAALGQHWNRIDLSTHRAAEAYVASLFGLARPGATILVSWDPFSFPTLYYQHVEGWRPDLTVIDTTLLRRSWYLRQLMNHHAAAVLPAAREIEAFLEAVAPFEQDLPYDGRAIEARYRAMIRSLVVSTLAAGRDVYATERLDPALTNGHAAEPLYLVYRLKPATSASTAIDPGALRLQDFLARDVANDRMSGYLHDHLEALAAERARWCAEVAPCTDTAFLQRLISALAAARREASARTPGEGVVQREVPDR